MLSALRASCSCILGHGDISRRRIACTRRQRGADDERAPRPSRQRPCVLGRALAPRGRAATPAHAWEPDHSASHGPSHLSLTAQCASKPPAGTCIPRLSGCGSLSQVICHARVAPCAAVQGNRCRNVPPCLGRRGARDSLGLTHGSLPVSTSADIPMTPCMSSLHALGNDSVKKSRTSFASASGLSLEKGRRECLRSRTRCRRHSLTVQQSVRPSRACGRRRG